MRPLIGYSSIASSLVVVVMSCSAEEKQPMVPVMNGGAVGTGGSTSAGATATSGGTQAATSGGASTGGSSPGAGGASAGTAATTGGVSTGGAVATTGGSGGGATGGTVTTTGGKDGQAGGGASAGGAAGGAPSGGSGGATVAGGGSVGVAGGGAAGLPTISELFPPGDKGALDGRLIASACGEANPQGTDCASDGAYLVVGGVGTKYNCMGALNVQQTYPVAGMEGATYQVTMHFYGVMEPKIYGQGVTREAENRPGNQNDGAQPTPWATAPAGHTYPGSDYNTYEIHVDDENDEEVAVYYMNADTNQGHWTYVIDYEKQIEVIGGGRIRTRVYDANCRQIKNCGPENTAATDCDDFANDRVISITGVDPAPMNAPANQGGLVQPNLITARDAGSSGQWWLIDIVSVDSVE